MAILGLMNYYAGYLMSNFQNYQAIDRCFDNALDIMETVWYARPESSLLDAVLAVIVDSLGSYFEHRGLWQLGDRWIDRAISLRRDLGSGQDRLVVSSREFYRRAILAEKAWAARGGREMLA